MKESAGSLVWVRCLVVLCPLLSGCLPLLYAYPSLSVVPPIEAMGDWLVTTGDQVPQYNIWDHNNPPRRLVAVGVVRDRALYIGLQGGIDGTDYQLRFTVNDTAGNTWSRTALILCAQTS